MDAKRTLRSLIAGSGLLLGACNDRVEMPTQTHANLMHLDVAVQEMYDDRPNPLPGYLQRVLLDEDHDGTIDVVHHFGVIDYVSPSFRAKNAERFADARVMSPEMEDALNDAYRAHQKAALIVGRQMFSDGLVK